MTHRIRTLAAGTAVGLVTLVAPGLPASYAAHPVDRAAAPTISVKMTAKSLTLSDAKVRAGLVSFEATTKKGDHVLQILKLHTGYTLQQAFADVQAGLNNGKKAPDLDAIARLDHNITWLGGAETKPGVTGAFDVRLKAGQYLAIDQQGNGLAQLKVTGGSQARSGHATKGTITTFTYGFRTDGKVAANGWVKVTNRADQPHFVILQHVKPGTTRHQVVKFFASGGNGKPPWALPGSTGLGVISPGTSVSWHVDVPKGHYVAFCFWPDLNTGMPHVAMGMLDLLTLS